MGVGYWLIFVCIRVALNVCLLAFDLGVLFVLAFRFDVGFVDSRCWFRVMLFAC